MPPRLYKRHCSMCGISHTKPTGRKCTRSTMAMDTNALVTSTITGGHVLNSASMSSLACLTSVGPNHRGVPSVLNHATTKFENPNINHHFPDVFIIFPSDAIMTRPSCGPQYPSACRPHWCRPTPAPHRPTIPSPKGMTNMENREAQRQASQVGSPPAATSVRTAEGANGGWPAPPDPSDARVAALVQEQLQRLEMECSSD